MSVTVRQRHLNRLAASSLFVIFLCLSTSCARAERSSQASGGENENEVVAVIRGKEITRKALKEQAQTVLEALDQERQAFEAEQQRKLHEALRGQLDKLISEELIALEAKSRDMSQEELIAAEVKDFQPSEEEIDQIYEINKGRLRVSKEQARQQIVDFLVERKREERRKEFVDGLRAKYEVDDRMDHFRYEIAADGHPQIGKEDASVVLVEWSDFECPFCTRMNDSLTTLMTKYEGKVRRVFRQFPLRSIHPNAQGAAEASLCADEQGKFWDMHARLFEQPRELGPDALRLKGEEIGLDMKKFESCLDSRRFSDKVQSDLDEGRAVGVSGTPALYINGRPVRAGTPEQISEVIEEELKRQGGR